MRSPPDKILDAPNAVVPPTPASTLAPRFTLDGSDALERHLKCICQDILVRVLEVVPAKHLEAILLGGGYGRGEGGVLKTANGDLPYNDLEFYVCLRGNAFFARHRYRARLHHLACELTNTIGIDIEFQVISRRRLRQAQGSMFYYDLVAGHRWIFGDKSLLEACEHLRSAEGIHASEATRLLMNRCTGLLLALEKLARFDSEDADFVGRNIAKAQLALGDAVLTSFGQYHWSCLERASRLDRLLACRRFPWGEAVRLHHADGVKFKLHPQRAGASRGELSNRLADITDLAGEVWLWLENRRLGRDFSTLREYALSGVDKCPGTARWRNCLLNLMAFRSPLCLGRVVGRHPRERLLNALVILLWGCGETANGPPSVDDVRFLQSCLRTKAVTRQELVEAYLKLWKRFQ